MGGHCVGESVWVSVFGWECLGECLGGSVWVSVWVRVFWVRVFG